MENDPSRVLIIDTAWLGDVIFTTSLIGAVNRAWPEAEVHVMVAPRGEALLLHQPQVTRLWVFDKRGRQKSWTALRKLAHDLREARFDLVLNAHPSPRSRVLTRFVRAPISVGYAGLGSRYCFTDVVPNDLAVEPDHVERRINLLRVLRPDAQAEPLRTGRNPDAVDWARVFLQEHKAESGPLLALVCGSAWETKRWSKESFAELARRWSTEHGGRVLLFGGHGEKQDIEFIVSHTAAIPVVNAPLPRVAALLSCCETTVGNDTGVTFLAIAAGCRQVIAVYGSTQVNYRFAAPHKALHAGVPCCLPRTGHGAHRCKWSGEPWCMRQISADRVWREISGASDG